MEELKGSWHAKNEQRKATLENVKIKTLHVVQLFPSISLGLSWPWFYQLITYCSLYKDCSSADLCKEGTFSLKLVQEH